MKVQVGNLKISEGNTIPEMLVVGTKSRAVRHGTLAAKLRGQSGDVDISLHAETAGSSLFNVAHQNQTLILLDGHPGIGESNRIRHLRWKIDALPARFREPEGSHLKVTRSGGDAVGGVMNVVSQRLARQGNIAGRRTDVETAGSSQFQCCA